MKDIAFITIIALNVLAPIAFIVHTDLAYYEAEQHAKRAYLDLKVRYKEADADIAKLRALELKYACELVSKHGETYTKEKCQG